MATEALLPVPVSKGGALILCFQGLLGSGRVVLAGERDSEGAADSAVIRDRRIDLRRTSAISQTYTVRVTVPSP